MKYRITVAAVLMWTVFWAAACRPVSMPATATIDVTFAIANGTTGFAATIYAQEVNSGATLTALYAAYSDPISMTVPAPGTYVVYARLVEAPDDYHFGASICPDGAAACDQRILAAVDVVPGATVPVTVSDRSPLLPERDRPVTVPWQRAP